MATLHQNPAAPLHISDPRKAAAAASRSRMSYQPMPSTAQSIPTQRGAEQFYGHEYIARLCARFITHLFACPEYPPSSTSLQSRLPQFIAYALHRTKLHSSVTFAALVLLQRLKARFPTARGSSGHRLFISAFMIASKVICDDTYSNKSWTIVAQGMFTLREINQMEREMCNYLDWELTVDNPILSNFEAAVKQDFSGPQGPFPTYSLQMVSKRAIKAASSTTATPIPEPNSTTSPIPSFGQRHSSPAASTESSPAPRPKDKPSYSNSSSPMPDTPSPSFSNTSPASSASPKTPIGPEDFSAKIHGVDTHYDGFSMSEDIPPHHPLKGKMFAHAAPCGW
ncbi:cyclin-like protein [Marasmius fiardii PR-910]|nr:cyclin-like protein [Marasmius fiardii PR-910]